VRIGEAGVILDLDGGVLLVTGLTISPLARGRLAEETKEKAAEVSNAPDTMLRADAITVRGEAGAPVGASSARDT
jgi:hypothetical protein